MELPASVVPLDPEKQRALAVLPLISGFASCCASLWIIVEVVTTREKLYTVYNRLLLAMSIVDVLASIGHMLGPLPMPEDEYEDDVAWAKGNDSTCTAQGFLVQLGIVAPIYHVCLSIYYLLLVKFEVTQDRIVKYAEPLMHSTALLVGFGTGFTSLVNNLFTNATLWCWITPVPRTWRVFLFYFPLWSSMLLVLGINVWIYDTVHKREKKAEKLHAIHHQKHGCPMSGHKRTSMRVLSVTKSHSSKRMGSSKQPSSTREPRVSFTFGHHPSRIFLENASNKEDGSKKDESSEREEINGSRVDESVSEPLTVSSKSKTKDPKRRTTLALSEVAQTKRRKSLFAQRSSIRDSFRNSRGFASRLMEMFSLQTPDEPSFMFSEQDVDDEQVSGGEQEENSFYRSLNSIQKLILPERTAKRFSRKIRKRQTTASTKEAQAKFVLATVEDFPSAARQYAATYQIGARLILYQSMAYIVGFWTIWVFPTAHQIVLMQDPQKIYWLICFQAFFEPLQGFFNFSVYRFAHFMRLKELHPKWPMIKLFRHTMRWTFSTKRSDSVKAKRENVARNSRRQSADIIKSAHVNGLGELRTGNASDDSCDSDSEDSDSGSECFAATKCVSPSTAESSRSIVLYRMSSLMGNLMAEFSEYPNTLNGNYMEVTGEDLFSYPTASFPTIYDRQSFSGGPSNFPSVVPMSDLPVGKSLFHGMAGDVPPPSEVPMDPLNETSEADQSTEHDDDAREKGGDENVESVEV